MSGPQPRPPAARFWPKVQRGAADECWPWLASKTLAGYGQFGLEAGKNIMAHRFAYQEVVGPIPDGLHLDHLCRVRHCVNPAHLEPVTPGENIRRGERAMAQRCKRDHPFDSENTYMDPRGRRQCRACRAGAARRSRHLNNQEDS